MNFCRRFTGDLSKCAKSVLAVDFIEKFIKQNKTLNEESRNIDFLCADVTKLDRPAER